MIPEKTPAVDTSAAVPTTNNLTTLDNEAQLQMIEWDMAIDQAATTLFAVKNITTEKVQIFNYFP